MEHTFTNNIKAILKNNFGKNAETIFEKSFDEIILQSKVEFNYEEENEEWILWQKNKQQTTSGCAMQCGNSPKNSIE